MKRVLPFLATVVAVVLIGALSPSAYAAALNTPALKLRIVDGAIAVAVGSNFVAGSGVSVSFLFGAKSQAVPTTVASNGTFAASALIPDGFAGVVKATASRSAAAPVVTGKSNAIPAPTTLGVGGVATPSGAIKSTADSASDLEIKDSGTPRDPKVYDGQNHTVGTIKIRANWVVVQNFKIRATGQYGIDSKGTHVTIRNNDIKNVHASGDGDLNAITFHGDFHSILYNTAINFVTGDAGGSHTDAIQTWNTHAGDSSSNVLIRGNRFEGPPDEGPATAIHQGIMCEGKDSTDGGGGGTGITQNWLVDGNYFVADLKFDDCDNVKVTRNTFASNDKKAVVVTSLTSGFKYFSDNKITGNIGDVGAAITAGPGPSKF